MSFITSTKQLETFIISQAGEHGLPGTQEWSGWSGGGFGANGHHGRTAAPPAPGFSGRLIDVEAWFDPEKPTEVQVTSNLPADGGLSWRIDPDHDLLLNCHGGAGGAGGLGEPGGQGGQGWDGRDATKHHSASNGGDGGHGGNGGFGTNGADGGAGGHVSILVDESHLDTLLAMQWNVLGGVGGIPGQHGPPGGAGQGGRGGAGFTWTEEVSYYEQPNYWRDSDGRIIGEIGGGHYTRTETRHNSPGRAGRNGRHGTSPQTPLYPGRNGAPGSATITVKHGNARNTYASRYWLVVTGFDIVDENDDGIFEPGEHIVVSNIKVKNTGPMPSPASGSIKVLIRQNQWLEPVAEPIEFPLGIQPGQTSTIQGTLRALIRREQVPLGGHLGTAFRAEDTVELIAYSERLKRIIPEFKGGERIIYQYPITLGTPKYLDAIAKGETVSFSWDVTNISTKPYGKDSPTGRSVGTSATNANNMLVLSGATPDSRHRVFNMIPLIEPGRTITLTVKVKASEYANDFQKDTMVVALGLANTGTDYIRSLTTYHLNVQVSAAYKFNPNAQFLLVINSSAPSEATHKLVSYIEKEICLSVDVFNISLTGSYYLPSGENICTKYAGKTIAILGNTLTYFQKGTREPWDLLDVAEVYSLSQRNTVFMFLGPENLPSLKMFTKLVSNPLPPLLHTQQSATSISDVLSRLQKTNGPADEVKLYTVSVKKSMFSGLDSSVKSRIEDIQKQLTAKYPLRRFLIAPCEKVAAQDAKKESESAIAIVEGLPQRAKMLVSTRLGGSSTSVSTYDAYMVMLSMPFADQCAIYWNVAQVNTHANTGMKATAVYKGLAFGARNDVVNAVVGDSMDWAILDQLEAELGSFVSSAPWPDTIPESSILSQLPLFKQFIAGTPPASTMATTTKRRVTHVALVLGALLAAAGSSSAISRPGSRVSRTRKTVQRAAEGLLSALSKAKIADPPGMKELGQSGKKTTGTQILFAKEPRKMVELAEKLSKEATEAVKAHQPDLRRAERLHLVSKVRLRDRTGNNEFMTLAQLAGPPGAVALSVKDVADRRGWEASLRMKTEADVAWSRERIAGMRAGAQAQGPASPVTAANTLQGDENFMVKGYQ